MSATIFYIDLYRKFYVDLHHSTRLRLIHMHGILMHTCCLLFFLQGSVRRKKKIVIKEHTNDDRKIQTTLKKIGLSEIPYIDEVRKYIMSLVLLKLDYTRRS